MSPTTRLLVPSCGQQDELDVGSPDHAQAPGFIELNVADWRTLGDLSRIWIHFVAGGKSRQQMVDCGKKWWGMTRRELRTIESERRKQMEAGGWR